MKSEWKEVALGDVLEPVFRSERVKPEAKYSLIGVRLEGRGAFHRETKLGINISSKQINKVQNGDFIYSRLFAWRGAFSLIDQSLDGKYASNEFPIFRTVKANQIDLKFLSYRFRQPTVWRTVEENCQGSTPVTRNRFKEEYFLKLRFYLPEFKEQKQIVSHLDSIEERLNRVLKLREEQEKELLAAFRSCFHQIESTAEWFEMGEVAPLVRRPIVVEPDGAYPELGIRSFGKGTFHKPSVLGMETNKRLFEIHEGDLIFSNVFAWEGAIGIARKVDHGRFGSHRFITCVCDPKIVFPEILQFYFLTSDGLDKIGHASPGGAGRNRTLGIKKLEKIRVPIPSKDRQLEFMKLMKFRQEIQKRREKTFQHSDALLPSLLDRIFNGT